MKTFTALKTELLQDPKIEQEYLALAPQFALASQIIALRQQKGLTQAQLAERAGTKQTAIARLESGNYNPSLKFLEKIAHALGSSLTVKLR